MVWTLPHFVAFPPSLPSLLSCPQASAHTHTHLDSTFCVNTLFCVNLLFPRIVRQLNCFSVITGGSDRLLLNRQDPLQCCLGVKLWIIEVTEKFSLGWFLVCLQCFPWGLQTQYSTETLCWGLGRNCPQGGVIAAFTAAAFPIHVLGCLKAGEFSWINPSLWIMEVITFPL